MSVVDHSAISLLKKYAPRTLSEVAGQLEAVSQLLGFVAKPYPCAMLFHGPTGVGKSVTAKCLARDIGCLVEDWELGGLSEIPSGSQDGKSVDFTIRSLRLRPLCGSGWNVVIVNEADTMTIQAENIWLDGLEHLPWKSIIIFTTNNINSLSERFVGRCEIIRFDGSSIEFRAAMHTHIRKVIRCETGKYLKRLPDNLGRYEMASDDFSIRLAMQQITPFIRSNKPMPEAFVVPFIRSKEDIRAEVASNAARKAWATRRATN